ncbi:nucleic acid dioxygenase ALKBH1 [Lingula anatina]|uniref:Nucleic acid dioxygenase ALKBH1 n=1 Tax=Lingula anatina TaxID=7574 RepID=A0A1S3JM76_LINAN|nr:nucleic acid dioxygenase ALKBH1 [Lingula anatina]|eukprot:XP_013411477.1 nucleic acid dioxygenase ALKBH1 [Lingula anatina]
MDLCVSSQSVAADQVGKDLFKEAYKFYARRKPPPDFKDVIDFRETKNHVEVDQVPYSGLSGQDLTLKGLIPTYKWEVFTLTTNPGFFFIRNPFEPHYQKYWVKRCLEDYHNKPNKTNIDAHLDEDRKENLWETHVKDPSHSNMKHLHWATLGYQYDWNEKKYHKDQCTAFPEDLSLLSSIIAERVGFPAFTAQASIVNYYHLNSKLGGHVDYSEFDHDAPLLSISFGQSAIFLLGGVTKSVKPVAMYINSGDVVVMSGAARLAYHAVPRILPGTLDKLDSPLPVLVDAAGKTVSQGGNLPVSLSLNTITQTCHIASNIDAPDIPQKQNAGPDQQGNGARGQTANSLCSNCQSHMKVKVLKLHKSESVQRHNSEICSGCYNAQLAKSSCSREQIYTDRGKEQEISAPSLQEVTKEGAAQSDLQNKNEKLKTVNEKIARDLHHLQWAPLREWLETGRINVNVRQVLKHGHDFPEK